MKLKYLIAILSLSIALFAYKKTFSEPNVEIVLKSDVIWEQLNPARGDQSPQAANLWGNRTEEGAAGFLLKPVDGFRSPPHIHNIAYRGVVISGLLHNNTPNADNMWMPQGSYWTQPAGAVHITAAKGKEALAYIEVEDAFGVLPAHEKFENEERPINVDKSNIVWLDNKDINWLEINENSNVKIAFLWKGKNNLKGELLKLDRGLNVNISAGKGIFRAIVVQGNPILKNNSNSELNLQEGSYFSSSDKAIHNISTDDDVIIYIRTNTDYSVK